MSQSLNDFIRDKSRRANPSSNIDWNQRRDEYLTAVGSLYDQVHAWLQEPLSQGAATLSRRGRELSEDHIGTYAIEDLVLTVGDEEVLFSPKGRNVVGASGRVDVLGERGQATLLLMLGPRWSVLVSRQPTMKMEPLDEQHFAALLRNVMRP